MDILAEAIAAYQTALDQLPAQKTDTFAAQVMSVLLARDRLAQALSQSAPTVAAINTIGELDQRLRSAATSIDGIVGSGTLAAWRESKQATASAWWWHLDERAAEAERPSVAWALLAGFFLTISLSITADIARRFLAVGPDFLGVFSTLMQGFLTFLAGRSLTEAGQRQLEHLLASLNIRRRYAHMANTAAALAVLLLVISLRLSLPSLARYYSAQGAILQQSDRITDAILSYQRAISLSPNYAHAHYNLGTAYEQSLAYDLAIASYQAALRSNSRLAPVYNNLARVYLAQGNYSNALPLLNSGLDMEPDMPQADKIVVRYSLYKNRGWANLGLKYLNQAESDAREALALRPEGAAAHCLLAEVLEARGNDQAALGYWENCLAYEKIDTLVPVEARWLGLARERLSEATKK